MRKGMWPMVAALAMAAGVAVGSPVRAAGGAQVLMVDNEPDLTNWHFDPAQLTVPAGSTVVWHNKGKEEHSVTADDKSFDSGYKRTGTDFQRTFARPGNYAYHCAPHPWMTGTVRVVAAAVTTTTPTTAAATTTTVAAVPPPGATASSVPVPGDPAAPETTTSSASGSATAPATGGASGAAAAAPAGSRRHSRDRLPGTVAVVLVPTLAGLAIGAKLRPR